MGYDEAGVLIPDDHEETNRTFNSSSLIFYTQKLNQF